MNRQEILQSLDEEIVRLQQVKDLLQGNRGLGPSLEKLVSNGTANGSGHRPRRRNMSEEGRRRIAEAQRLRWARAKANK